MRIIFVSIVLIISIILLNNQNDRIKQINNEISNAEDLLELVKTTKTIPIPPPTPYIKKRWKNYNKTKECLIRNVFYESPRYNPYDENITEEKIKEIFLDRVKVINVTINRVKSSKYPNTVCDVVYQYKQFSWTLDSKKKTKPIFDIYKNDRIELKNYSDVKKIVEYYMANDYKIPDITSESLYYHSHKVSPYWKNTKEFTVASKFHAYYK